MFDLNPLLLTDSYKTSHWTQYPPGTTSIVSYLEPRGGNFQEAVSFGGPPILEKYLVGQVVTAGRISQAERIVKSQGAPFNRAGWEYILKAHNGYLPIRIKMPREGTVIPVKNVMMTIENTDPKCFWLTNYVESLLLHEWYSITVATLSRELKKIIRDGLKQSGDLGGLPFKLHDFGFRGASSVETACRGGAAHLVNFYGTDNLAALMHLEHFYNMENCEVVSMTIPATEHSTITSWGRENEKDAYENFLDQNPTGGIACVSDSYDIWNACENLWGKELKDKVSKRDGFLAVRPDSGRPEVVVVKVVETLMKAFGYTVNDKGYRVLPPQVRVIQADGLNLDSLRIIVDNLLKAKISLDNITFGMGGGLLQHINRDTMKFAIKCSQAVVNGEARDVFKDPIDDPGKKSKVGRLKLIYNDGWNDNLLEGYNTVREEEFPDMPNQLNTVFENGVLTIDDADRDFQAIRQRADLT